MRTFSAHDKEIIGHLLNADRLNPGTVTALLNACYFKEAHGRALILQNQGEYAVFFLKPELFDNPAKRDREVQRFFELLTLLNYLNRNGHITIYRHTTEKLYYLQDSFTAPKVVNNTIFLNAKGDCSVSPDTILDRNKKVIYKGIIFRNDHYHLILDTVAGALLVSDSLGSAGKRPAAAPSTGRRWRTLLNCLFYILVSLACAASLRSDYILYRKMEDRSRELIESFRQVSESSR
jgi:hypothetical protein